MRDIAAFMAGFMLLAIFVSLFEHEIGLACIAASGYVCAVVAWDNRHKRNTKKEGELKP